MERHVKILYAGRFFKCCLALCMCLGLSAGCGALKVHAEEAQPEYRIMVNRAENCVTVYERDAAGEFTVPVKAFACSCGREGHATPLGTFRTSDYYDWRQMVDGSYGQYAVRFHQKIMFHSVPYYTRNAGNMEWEQYNLLGEAASLGCVRLACADAKWIYDNCRPGTEVVVYDDAGNPGPLGKPTEQKLTEGESMKKWDPTDMNLQNPWNERRPSLYLTGSGSAEILWLPVGASQQDIYSVIGMKDAAGDAYDVGEYTLHIFGQYDLSRAGVYKISVRGAGELGMRAEEELMTLYVW